VATTASPADPYFKKTITVRIQRRQLELDVAQDLFSGHDLDAGTRLLLRSLATPEQERRLRVLDLGSGYGPLGLGLKLLNPARQVEMVDRDALAVEYSRRNAERNGMSGVDVHGGLGWRGVGSGDLDLVVSNLPAKAGDRAIRHFLLDASPHLRPDGLVAVVVIARLHELVQGILDPEAGVEVVYRHRAAGYSVFHYGFAAEGPLPGRSTAEAAQDPLGAYQRGTLELAFDDVRYGLRTVYSLAEFDTLAYHTRLMAAQLLDGRRRPRRVLVFNPGQGHLPVLIGKALRPDSITLAGRDLLALANAGANLAGNGYPPERVLLRHQAAVLPADVDGVDLVVASLRDGQPNAITEHELGSPLAALRSPCRVVVGGSSTAVTRLESSLAGWGSLRVIGRKRNRGHSVLEARA
jgi:16S rRNA (guanine1207-N2)-methyltransferase